MSEPPVPSPRGIPPGVHLCAEVFAGGRHHQLRILGDDERGYLLVGLSALPGHEADEFWFPTLDGATGMGSEVGVPPGGWGEIESVDSVRVG